MKSRVVVNISDFSTLQVMSLGGIGHFRSGYCCACEIVVALSQAIVSPGGCWLGLWSANLHSPTSIPDNRSAGLLVVVDLVLFHSRSSFMLFGVGDIPSRGICDGHAFEYSFSCIFHPREECPHRTIAYSTTGHTTSATTKEHGAASDSVTRLVVVHNRSRKARSTSETHVTDGPPEGHPTHVKTRLAIAHTALEISRSVSFACRRKPLELYVFVPRQRLPWKPHQCVAIGTGTDDEDIIYVHLQHHHLYVRGIALVPQSGRARIFPKLMKTLFLQIRHHVVEGF